MGRYDYLVGGITITNDILFADGSTIKGQLGGCLFSLTGVRLWTDRVLYLSNVGEDFDRYYGDWFQKNGLSTEGACRMMEHTYYTNLTYRPDGTYHEEDIYTGKSLGEGGTGTAVKPAQVEQFCEGVKGMYLDESVRSVAWDGLFDSHKKCGYKLMWEIPTYDLMDDERHKEVLELMEKVDFYSMNKPESFHFFGVDNEGDAIRAIKRLGKPCFYRVGKCGSYMVMGDEAAFAPSVDIGAPVDPTGCGNCSTASAMYCLSEGYDPLMTAVMSNIAAAFNILQHGPFGQYTEKTELAARRLAEKIYFALK